MQHTLPVIGLVNSHYFLNQSDEKHNPIKTWSPTFSHTLGCLVSLTLSSHWLWKINSFLPISPGNCFSYGFMTLNWKVLYWKFSIKLKYTHQKQKQKKVAHTPYPECTFSQDWSQHLLHQQFFGHDWNHQYMAESRIMKYFSQTVSS